MIEVMLQQVPTPDISKFLTQETFSMFIAVFLLVRFEARMGQVAREIKELRITLAVMLDRNDNRVRRHDIDVSHALDEVTKKLPD